MLTTYADDESILDALRAGAIGYLTKDAARDHIRRAIEAAAAGQAVLDPAVQARLVEVARLPSSDPSQLPDGLTDARRSLAPCRRRQSNSDIAKPAVCQRGDVKTHVNHIFAKTNSRDRAQAVTYAHRHGLTSSDE